MTTGNKICYNSLDKDTIPIEKWSWQIFFLVEYWQFTFSVKKHGKHLKKPTATTKKNKNRYFVSKHLTEKQTTKQPNKKTKNEKLFHKNKFNILLWIHLGGNLKSFIRPCTRLYIHWIPIKTKLDWHDFEALT